MPDSPTAPALRNSPDGGAAGPGAQAPAHDAAWKADAYAAENSGQYATAMEALALAGAHLHSGGRFADVGCGTGEIAAAMAERHFSVAASDGSLSMVEATRRRCAGLDVVAEHQDAHELKLPEDEFDVVHSSWMLHWLRDPATALQAMARAVRPGGQLVLQWSFGQPADAGFPMRDVLDEVVARPAWRARLAATPLAMYHHPVEQVRAALAAQGLEILLEERDIVVPGGRDPESLRKVTRTTAFSAQADVLGDDADAFIDEALHALFASGHANVHNTRLIARRPESGDAAEDAQAPALVRPFPQAVGILEVVATESLTPLMRRIVLRGESLAGMTVDQPGEIVTLIWPAEGHREIELPEPGKWRFAGGRSQHTRNFTVRRHDAANRLLTIDFFLHGEHGRAARWAAAARPGDTVGFGGSRVHWTPDPAARWTLLVGDETALPAMSAIIATLPDGHPVLAVAEVRDRAERPAFEAGTARVFWIHRDEREPGVGRALEDAVRGLTLPAGPGQVWGAGESLAVQSLRRHLTAERGLPKSAVSVLGYWNRPRGSAAS
ncbi:SIP domain-containing protein [Yinghuangia soli]|uniref:SIP domain-containing protein n=1 Tax=Yinghuangia soli TaxID=2908204 RepID=A0AA41U521_9ACTN|nr:SIP domain-containing protein [Yinghuangia soli]MCF2533535.1 SIP domain-containing protein [Yinghuangia soli]